MPNDRYVREVKAAGIVYAELEAALEASYGSYCEPSGLEGRMITGNILEVRLRNGSRYLLKVEEIEGPRRETS